MLFCSNVWSVFAEFSLTCVLGAYGPLLGRQEERWAEIVAERAELQQAVDAAGAGSLVQDLIALLDQSMVCQKYIHIFTFSVWQLR